MVEMILSEAVKSRNFEAIKKAVQAGADLNAKENDKRTPLQLAFDQHDPEMIEFLLRLGADFKSMEKTFQDYLWFMDPAMMELIANFGFDFTFRSEDGCTILHNNYFENSDSSYDDVKEFEDNRWRLHIFKDAGVDFNDRRNDRGNSPLMEVISVKVDAPLLNVFVECGAIADLPCLRTLEGSNFIETPLHLLVYHPISHYYYRHKESATALAYIIEHSVQCLDIRNENGSTPLHLACAAGNQDCVRLLLKAGVDVTARDCENLTPLYYALYEFDKRHRPT